MSHDNPGAWGSPAAVASRERYYQEIVDKYYPDVVKFPVFNSTTVNDQHVVYVHLTPVMRALDALKPKWQQIEGRALWDVGEEWYPYIVNLPPSNCKSYTKATSNVRAFPFRPAPKQ